VVVASFKIDHRLGPHATDDLANFTQPPDTFRSSEEISPIGRMLSLDTAGSQTKFQPPMRDDIHGSRL